MRSQVSNSVHLSCIFDTHTLSKIDTLDLIHAIVSRILKVYDVDRSFIKLIYY